jgi:predicted RNase H-like nuclease (RuvC/YqgF family)
MKMNGKMWAKNRELIKNLEEENKQLKATIEVMAKNMQQLSNRLYYLENEKKKEWTIDPSKNIKY